MELSIHSDDYLMSQALREAELAFREEEVPVGCVITLEGKIIGRGHNRMETLKDPTAHAEILAIGAACQNLDNWRLDDCVLYATVEPCPMCAGAILNSRIGRVVYGTPDIRLGAVGSTYDILRNNPIHREIEISGNVRQEECAAIIKEFFQQRRKANKEFKTD